MAARRRNPKTGENGREKRLRKEAARKDLLNCSLM
jgi:hypothetical protein